MGPAEIALVLVIILLIFGPGKLPDVGSALGKGIRGFRKAASGAFDDDEKQKGPAQLPASHASSVGEPSELSQDQAPQENRPDRPQQ